MNNPLDREDWEHARDDADSADWLDLRPDTEECYTSSHYVHEGNCSEWTWEDQQRHDWAEKTLEEKVDSYAVERAIAMHDHEVLRHMLDRGMNPNISLSDGKTPLLRAAERADMPLADLFLEYGACPFYTDYGLPTPVKLAAKDAGLASSIVILHRALEISIERYGESDDDEDEVAFEITTIDRDGIATTDSYSALELAVYFGVESIVRAAIDAGFDVFGNYDQNKESLVSYPEMDMDDDCDRLIYLALKKENFSIAKLIIEARTRRLNDPDSKIVSLDSKERTALQERVFEDIARVERAKRQQQTARQVRGLDTLRPIPTPLIDIPDDEIPF